MAAGIVWAVIGFAACELLNRGRLFTTVVTAVAGASGLGMGAVEHYHTSVPAFGAVLVGAEVAVVLAGVIILVWTAHARGGRKHGSAALASTRHVIYLEPELAERARRRRRTDTHARTRPSGRRPGPR